MGGELKLDSRLGQGSTFHFQLRFALAQAPWDGPLKLMATAAKGRQLEGLRLLVVEDNRNNQQIVHELLSGEGADVQLADNGELGVAAVMAADPPFDVVLMDLQMPVMDGYAAARQIRQRLGLMDLPIIAITANAMATDREACLAAGMNEHVSKPFDLDQLVSTLLRHAGRATAPTPSSTHPAPSSAPGELPAELLEDAARRGIDLAIALHRRGGTMAVVVGRAMQRFQQQ